MIKSDLTSSSDVRAASVHPAGPDGAFPRAYSTASDACLRDPLARKLVEFFQDKGLARLKEEDRREDWYEDWVAFQAEHRLYARLLSPKQYSAAGGEFDLLRFTRFLEVFGYFSPAHGYSLQVTFLGLFSILMGSNEALKREAVAALEAGGLLAFGVSEKDHGSDLLGNGFTLREAGPGRFVANGTKYYIGNANCASIISVLARKGDPRSAGRTRRTLPVLFALRPKQSQGFGGVRKIRTLGVRAAFVGAFEVKDHHLPEGDLIADGRQAWDAIFGTVTLGKFFLGFGSIGICEHAFAEAAAHLRRRVLYGKPVIEMPHIRSTMATAYARLAAMKLYAYRALDYVHAARADDRRYLLYTAVQKAQVSTEGVKVMALLSECVGAKGFESDTYFEMALRDAQLIPGLEGSTHINLAVAAQFIPRYLFEPDGGLAEPKSLAAGEVRSGENPYLMEARSGAVNTIAFPPFLRAYGRLMAVANVRLFARQAKAFSLFVRGQPEGAQAADTEISLALGQCLASIAYGQLVAENCARLQVPPQMVSAMFHPLVHDLSVCALALASSPQLDAIGKARILRLVAVPRTRGAEWEWVSEQVAAYGAAG
jgi:acyl-CoA dehydrogenase